MYGQNLRVHEEDAALNKWKTRDEVADGLCRRIRFPALHSVATATSDTDDFRHHNEVVTTSPNALGQRPAGGDRHGISNVFPGNQKGRSKNPSVQGALFGP